MWFYWVAYGLSPCNTHNKAKSHSFQELPAQLKHFYSLDLTPLWKTESCFKFEYTTQTTTKTTHTHLISAASVHKNHMLIVVYTQHFMDCMPLSAMTACVFGIVADCPVRKFLYKPSKPWLENIYNADRSLAILSLHWFSFLPLKNTIHRREIRCSGNDLEITFVFLCIRHRR